MTFKELFFLWLVCGTTTLFTVTLAYQSWSFSRDNKQESR